MSVQPYAQQAMTLTTTPARDVIDGWATQVASIAKLADYIAPTDFVPRAYRGQPAAIAAAILAGREMGIGPMTALQHLNVIDGRPSQSAALMRALVIRDGHTLRILESSSERCTITGHRQGENTDRAPVTYTMADARQAQLLGRPNWQKHPRAMLLARATGEICRRDYSDVILGMPYTTEEAQDMDGATELDEAPPPKTSRTVQRSQKRQNTPASDAAQGQQAAVSPPSTPQPAGPPPPPLPDTPPEAPAAPQAPPEAPQAPADQPPPEQRHDAWENASGQQLAHLFALLGELGQATPRDRRLLVVSALIGRRLESMNQLTRGEATPLIDTLVRIKEGKHPSEEISWLVDEGTQRLDEKDAAAAELQAAIDPNQDALWDPEEGQEP